MKSIISKSVKAVAFDLDGTLYDEWEFIRQAYRSVSRAMEKEAGIDEDRLYDDMCRFWFTYGSSAGIFQMAYAKQKDCPMDDKLLKVCIDAFRNTEFELPLSQRVSDCLELMKDYPKAIITDGNSILQRRKFKALQLDRWIKEDCVFVSGDYGKEYYKPDPYMGRLAIEKLGTDRILYFGDREIDKKFAKNAGFRFRKVKNMILV